MKSCLGGSVVGCVRVCCMVQLTWVAAHVGGRRPELAAALAFVRSERRIRAQPGTQDSVSHSLVDTTCFVASPSAGLRAAWRKVRKLFVAYDFHVKEVPELLGGHVRLPFHGRVEAKPLAHHHQKTLVHAQDPPTFVPPCLIQLYVSIIRRTWVQCVDVGKGSE